MVLVYWGGEEPFAQQKSTWKWYCEINKFDEGLYQARAFVLIVMVHSLESFQTSLRTLSTASLSQAPSDSSENHRKKHWVVGLSVDGAEKHVSGLRNIDSG